MHFTTLTTAIYHWADLAAVLEEYERCTTAHRQGRRDPPEPGEAALPDGKRRVLQYSGVVAWYCALKLELYASYVLSYDDIFGVFEWGSGGIVHLHMLGWRSPGCGRYDCHEGEVPAQQRREDAKAMAWQHGAEVSEWNLARKHQWENTKDGFDEGLTPMNDHGNYGPAPETDVDEAAEEEKPDAAVTADMEELRALLQDPQWHPAAIPMHLKRRLLTCSGKAVRGMTRWFYTALTSKCYMHDRHAGDPVTIPPVYGDESPSEGDSEEEPEEEGEAQAALPCACVRLLTWNTNLHEQCSFVQAAAQNADVLCLQKVTPAAAEWLQAQLGETFELITPWISI